MELRLAVTVPGRVQGGASSWSTTYMTLSTVVVLGPKSAGAVDIFCINCRISVLCHRKSHLLCVNIAFNNEFIAKNVTGLFHFFPDFFYIYMFNLKQIIYVIFLSI